MARGLERRTTRRALTLLVAGLVASFGARPASGGRAGKASTATEPHAEASAATFSYRRLWARTRFSLAIAEALSERPTPARRDARERLLSEALTALVDELQGGLPDGPLDERVGLFRAFDELVATFDEERLRTRADLASLTERALQLTDGLASEVRDESLRTALARARVDWRLRQRWTVPAANLVETARRIEECAAILASPAGRAAYADGGEEARRRLSAWTDVALASSAWSLAGEPNARTIDRVEERAALLTNLFGGGPSVAGIEALLDRLRTDLALLADAEESTQDARTRVLRFLEARALVDTLAHNLDRTTPSPLSRERFLELCDVFDAFDRIELSVADRAEWEAIAPKTWLQRLTRARTDRSALDVERLLPSGALVRLLDDEGRAYPLEPLLVDTPRSWVTIDGVDVLLQLGAGTSRIPIVVHASEARESIELPPDLPLGVVVFVGPREDPGAPRTLTVLEASAWTRAQLVRRVMDLTHGHYITPPDGSDVSIWEPIYEFLVEFLGAPGDVDLRTHEGREEALKRLTRPDETAVLPGSSARRLLALLAESRATQLPSASLCAWFEPFGARALGWHQLHTDVRHLRGDEPVDEGSSYILREAYHLVLP